MRASGPCMHACKRVCVRACMCCTRSPCPSIDATRASLAHDEGPACPQKSWHSLPTNPLASGAAALRPRGAPRIAPAAPGARPRVWSWAQRQHQAGLVVVVVVALARQPAAAAASPTGACLCPPSTPLSPPVPQPQPHWQLRVQCRCCQEGWSP